MFPNYMNDILRDACCGHCDAPQTIADIWTVGVRRPEEFEAFYGEPVFVIITICEACGWWTNHSMRRSRTDAIAGVSGFIDLIERECRGKKPPINIPELSKKSAHPPAPTAGANAAQSTAENAGDSRPRPSLRSNQPNTPPTQREIQAFLHRLRKTSFRRKSKGFSNWMKGFEIDTDDTDRKSDG